MIGRHSLTVTHRPRGQIRLGRLYDDGYRDEASNRPFDAAGLTTIHFWANAGRLVVNGELKAEELA